MWRGGKQPSDQMAECHAHIAQMEREIFGGLTPSQMDAVRNVRLAQERVQHFVDTRGDSMPFEPEEWFNGH